MPGCALLDIDQRVWNSLCQYLRLRTEQVTNGTTIVSTRLASLLEAACCAFNELYVAEPTILVAAPGRVNLIGEHTDYNNGFVLPMAIDRHVAIAASPRVGVSPSRIRCYSMSLNSSCEIDCNSRPVVSEPEWSNYVRGVVAGLFDFHLTPPSMDICIASDIPIGAGLASSAALEVATAKLLEAACEATLTPNALARICRTAEHEFAHVPCGIMDQLICVLGGSGAALLIDCDSESTRRIPVGSLDMCFLVADTGVRHAHASNHYAMRHQQCLAATRKLGATSLRHISLPMLEANANLLDSVEYKRVRHVVTENERTVRAARALETGDAVGLGELMYQSHHSLRDDFEVSCNEADTLVQLASELGHAAGVFGARMTGGGFGGCTVMLLQPEAVEPTTEHLTNRYQRHFGRPLTMLETRAVQGARVVDILRQ